MNWLTVISLMIGSGGIFGFIGLLIQRNDAKNDRFAEIVTAIAELRKELKNLEAKSDQRDAESRRVRILKFEDELLDGKKHSKDSFDQVLSDITSYDSYCNSHPEFKNNQTAATIQHIQKVYAERLDKRDFL